MATAASRVLGTVAGIAIIVSAFVVARTLRERDPMPDAGEEFFERYVEPDGRVVRRDQGGDTVSEGQAYAMLIAVAARDRARFDRVWTWTREHLQNDDGTLAWRWRDGRVSDPNSAADADVDAAYALLLAGRRFGAAGAHYLREARHIADGILRTEVSPAGQGRVLAAGPWAVERGVVNPSYFDARAFRAFGTRSRASAWSDVERGGWDVLRRLTDDGERLPTDWAEITGASVRAISGPDDRRGPGTYGYDAPRAIIRSAVCRGGGERLASRWSREAIARADDADAHPVYVVAAAASAAAAGDDDARNRLLARALEIVRTTPTYYGWAWAALGPLWTDVSALGDCA